MGLDDLNKDLIQKIVDCLSQPLPNNTIDRFRPNPLVLEDLEQTLDRDLFSVRGITSEECIQFIIDLRDCKPFINLTYSSLFPLCNNYPLRGGVNPRDFKTKLMLLFMKYIDTPNNEEPLKNIAKFLINFVQIPQDFNAQQYQHDNILGLSSVYHWAKSLYNNEISLLDNFIGSLHLLVPIGLGTFLSRQLYLQTQVSDLSLYFWFDWIPIFILALQHSQDTGFHHISKLLFFLCVWFGTRFNYYDRFLTPHSNFFKIQALLPTVTQDEFVHYQYLLSSLLPVLMYTLTCKTEFSVISGSVLFFVALHDMYLQHEGFQISEENKYTFNQTRMHLNESVANPYSFLGLGVPLLFASSEKNDSLTHHVFLQLVLQNTRSVDSSLLLHRITKFLNVQDIYPDPAFCSSFPRNFQLVRQNLNQDLMHLSLNYNSILPNISTFETWVQSLSPSIRKVYNLQQQCIDTREYVPDVAVAHSNIKQLHEWDTNLTSMYFKMLHEEPSFANLVLYTHPIPYPNWENQEELFANFDYFINLTSDQPMFLSIFQKRPDLMQPFLPPTNYLYGPYNTTILWNVSSSSLTFIQKLELSFYTLLSNSSFNMDFAQDMSQLNSSRIKLLPNKKIFPIFYLACTIRRPQALHWVKNIEQYIWMSFHEKLQQKHYSKNLREYYCHTQEIKYIHFLEDMLVNSCWEKAIIEYLDELTRSYNHSVYGSYYHNATQIVVSKQYHFFLQHAPDFLNNLFQQDPEWQTLQWHSPSAYFQYFESFLEKMKSQDTLDGNTLLWLQTRNQLYRQDIAWYSNEEKPQLNKIPPEHLFDILPWSQHLFSSTNKNFARSLYIYNKSAFLVPLLRFLLFPTEHVHFRRWLFSLKNIPVDSKHIQATIDFFCVFLKPFQSNVVSQETLRTIQDYFDNVQLRSFFPNS